MSAWGVSRGAIHRRFWQIPRNTTAETRCGYLPFVRVPGVAPQNLLARVSKEYDHCVWRYGTSHGAFSFFVRELLCVYLLLLIVMFFDGGMMGDDGNMIRDDGNMIGDEGYMMGS